MNNDWWQKLVVLIPILSLLFDAVNAIIETGLYGGIIRGFTVGIFVFLFVYARRTKVDSIFLSFTLFSLYTLCISLLSSDYTRTFSSYLSVVIPFFVYIISYNSFNKSVAKFSWWVYAIPIIYVINIAIMTQWGLSQPEYPGQLFRFGGLHDNRLVFAALVLSISLIINKHLKYKKVGALLSLMLAICVIISLRRTAIILALVGVAFWVTSYSKKISIILIVGLLLTLFIIYNYTNILDIYLSIRNDPIVSSGSIEDTNRIREIYHISEKFFSFENVKLTLFGTEYLNSAGTYASAGFTVSPDRFLHSDYAVVLHGSGIIGLVLYYSIYLSAVVKTYKAYKLFGLSSDFFLLSVTVVTIFCLSTISGVIRNFTVGAAFFSILGAISGVVSEAKKRNSARAKSKVN